MGSGYLVASYDTLRHIVVYAIVLSLLVAAIVLAARAVAAKGSNRRTGLLAAGLVALAALEFLVMAGRTVYSADGGDCGSAISASARYGVPTDASAPGNPGPCRSAGQVSLVEGGVVLIALTGAAVVVLRRRREPAAV